MGVNSDVVHIPADRMHFGTLIDTELEPTDNSSRVELRAHSHALAGENGDLTAARSTQLCKAEKPVAEDGLSFCL